MHSIDSPQNPYIKHLVKLSQDSSYRWAEKKVLLEGSKLIAEIAPSISSGTLLVADSKQATHISHLENYLISPSVAKKLADTDSSEGIFLETSIPESSILLACHRLLVLDGVADPGNLGTLLRTALALGWQGVFFLPGCCDPFNSKVMRASKGALFRLPYHRGNWHDLKKIMEREDLMPLAADLQGTFPKEIPARLALVLGNEGQGLSKETRALCAPISIPMKGEMESLNVAVAGAILMYALRNPHG